MSLYWLATLFSINAIVLSAQMRVASANYENHRRNANEGEKALTREAVRGTGFKKLATIQVDGQIYAQPLYIQGVATREHGSKNVVYVATMNNTVYALDADNPQAPALWTVNLGPATPAAAIPGLYDISPQVGILSTPAIDTSGRAIYVVSETLENQAPVFQLHALSLAEGRELFHGPVPIAASVPGTAGNSGAGVVTFEAPWHLQRPGLALANGNVYVCFGSHGDTGNYHGWVMAYNATNLQEQTAVFNDTPNGNGGGIWQSGHAPSIDSSGNIYVVSGNGDFDGIKNFSGAVVKLSGSDLSVLDWFTPASWQYLDANDLDVGSTGAILDSGEDLLVLGDKGGRLVTLNPKSLGNIESTPGTNTFDASPAGIFDLALWQTEDGALLYEHDWNGYLKSYSLTASGISREPVSKGTWYGDSLYQGMAISSNGSADGILWETTGNHSSDGVPGTLHAWNASDLTEELWNSDMHDGDALGSFAKFVAPVVANGRVYVPTFSNQVVVYGLGQSAAKR